MNTKTKTVEKPALLRDANCIRLHFWNEDKSYYVVTDSIPQATKIMTAHTPTLICNPATNQTMDFLKEDIQLYFK